MDYYKKYQSQEWVDIQNEHANELKENNNLKIKPMKLTEKQLANQLINIKKNSFNVYINDYINLLFYYDKKDDSINITNINHFSCGDSYRFSIENINKIVTETFENNHELNN
jgi:hypothetical protein